MTIKSIFTSCDFKKNEDGFQCLYTEFGKARKDANEKDFDDLAILEDVK